jgi:molecular chaperone DnaK
MRHSIGIETRGGKLTKLSERGSALPATCSEIFTTADAGQTSIQINVFRGDHRHARSEQDHGERRAA